MVYTDKQGRVKQSVRKGKKTKTIYLGMDEKKKKSKVVDKPVDKLSKSIDELQRDLNEFCNVVLRDKSHDKELVEVVIDIINSVWQYSAAVLQGNPKYVGGMVAAKYINGYLWILSNWMKGMNSDVRKENYLEFRDEWERLIKLREKYKKMPQIPIEDMNTVLAASEVK